MGTTIANICFDAHDPYAQTTWWNQGEPWTRTETTTLLLRRAPRNRRDRLVIELTDDGG